MYKLIWIVGGIVREELFRNKPKIMCRWQAAQLKATTHKAGKLIIVPNDTRITKLKWKV